MLAPHGALRHLDREQFEVEHRKRLDGFGVAIAGVLRAFVDGHRASGAVLLCFENVLETEDWCHRRTFAAWWEEQTGAVVPELTPAQGTL